MRKPWETHRDPWASHGRPMGEIYKRLTRSMGGPRATDGETHGIPRKSIAAHGRRMAACAGGRTIGAHGSPMKVHGSPYGGPRKTHEAHGTPTGGPRKLIEVHGSPYTRSMQVHLEAHGRPKGDPWENHEGPTRKSIGAHGRPVEPLRDAEAVLVGSHECPVGRSWVYCYRGIPRASTSL